MGGATDLPRGGSRRNRGAWMRGRRAVEWGESRPKHGPAPGGPPTRRGATMTEPSAADFPTTHWSRIARAGDPAAPDAHAALAQLCRDYWFPVYALIRRRGHPPDDAADLTQEYFARL